MVSVPFRTFPWLSVRFRKRNEVKRKGRAPQPFVPWLRSLTPIDRDSEAVAALCGFRTLGNDQEQEQEQD